MVTVHPMSVRVAHCLLAGSLIMVNYSTIQVYTCIREALLLLRKSLAYIQPEDGAPMNSFTATGCGYDIMTGN